MSYYVIMIFKQGMYNSLLRNKEIRSLYRFSLILKYLLAWNRVQKRAALFFAVAE